VSADHTPNKVLLDFMLRYGPAAGEMGPLQLVREVFKADPDDWQASVLRDFGRGERGIAIRSAHGPGKTCVCAWMVWAMLLTRFPQKTVATAPTKGQLFDGLFTEVLGWGMELPDQLRSLYLMKGGDRIDYIPAPALSFFTAKTARPETPEALQGIHSDHVLLVGDEASGIPEPIFEAGAGSMSGEHATTVLLGNPIRSTGLFFDVFNKGLDGWKKYHVRAASVDWPTGIPSERVKPKFVKEMAQRYGEESNAFRTRVLGEFPKGDDDTVISFELVESARQRDIEGGRLPFVWGVDVARFGSARNAIVARDRRRLLSVETWEGVDLMQTAGRIKATYDALLPSERPYCILIDVNGLGGGVVDRLTELGLPVRGINVGEAAAIKERFLYLRDELWWRMRDWFEKRDISLPMGDMDDDWDPIETLAKELTQPRYKYQSSGKIKVESKDEMKKRGLRSPDIADALMLTFAEDVTVLSGGFSSYGGAGWNEDLPDRSMGVP
jgi:hypothetical protein